MRLKYRVVDVVVDVVDGQLKFITVLKQHKLRNKERECSDCGALYVHLLTRCLLLLVCVKSCFNFSLAQAGQMKCCVARGIKNNYKTGVLLDE